MSAAPVRSKPARASSASPGAVILPELVIEVIDPEL